MIRIPVSDGTGGEVSVNLTVCDLTNAVGETEKRTNSVAWLEIFRQVVYQLQRKPKVGWIRHQNEASYGGIFIPKSVMDHVARDFSACNTDAERREIYIKCFPWPPFEDALEGERSMKSAEKSTRFRQEGNECFAAKDYEGAIRKYNLALMYASRSEERAAAFANRSAALMRVEEPAGALEDIERAIADKYPEAKLKILDNRKRKCLKLLQKFDDDEDDKGMCEVEQEKRRRYCDDNVFRLKAPNPVIPIAESFVEVQNGGSKGDHLIVTKDVPPGTTLIVEDPYAVIPSHMLEERRSMWCHYCLENKPVGIPCPSCVFGFYCDESCRSNAWEEYHKYECGCTVVLDYYQATPHIFLVLRLFCKLGPKELFKLFNAGNDSTNEQQDNHIKTSSEFSWVHNWLTQVLSSPVKFDGGERHGHALQAGILVTVLDSCANFFESIPDGVKPDFKNFVSSLVLSFIESPLSALTLKELDLKVVAFFFALTEEPMGGGQYDTIYPFQEYALGFYPFSSLLQHSCDPNVFVQPDNRSGKIAVQTIRCLKAGEKLSFCYGQSFLSAVLDDRQSSLQQHFRLTCECIACREGWPWLPELDLWKGRLSCPSCALTFRYEDRVTNEFECCILNANELKCRRCGRDYSGWDEGGDQFDLIAKFTDNIALKFSAKEMIKRNRPCEAISGILTSLRFFQEALCPPVTIFYDTQEAYKIALALIVRFAG